MSREQNTPTAFEVKAAVDQLGRAFEEFKSTHNSADASKRTDALVEQKMARINQDMSQLQKSIDRMHMMQQRPAQGGKVHSGLGIEHKQAFVDGYMRKGRETGLASLEEKALSTSVASDGGYTVPEELDRSIDALLKDVSPVRAVANVVQIGSSNYKKLVSTSGPASGWVAENGARIETSTPNFAEVVPPLGEIYANPAATQAMLDDAFFNVEQWLADELSAEFAAQEGSAFINGDGVNKPKGFLSYTTAATDDGVRAFGTIEHVATGVSANFAAADPADILIDLVHALRPVYRKGAVFMMNTNLLAIIRKFKDANGDYLWRPGLADGGPATLMGYPVIEAEDMPDMAAGSLSVAFGNFQKAYTITDRMGTRILRDPYSNKPYVHFYATKRVGGGVVNSEAVKLLKFALA